MNDITLNETDICFVNECSLAAMLIRRRLQALQKHGKTNVLDNDILALEGIAVGLALIVDKAKQPVSVPAHFN